MRILNPADGAVLDDIEADTPDRIRASFERLKVGRLAWAAKPLDERIGCLKRFGEVLLASKDELARTLSLETGKPIQEARSEIAGAANRVRFFVENAAEWLSPRAVNEASGVREVVAFEPLGVVANVSAWNYPYLTAMNVIVPALIAGNAVLYKPSEFSTLSGLHMQRLLLAAGVPQDAFQAVVGDGAVGRAVVALPLDGFFFTGSYRTGQAIAASLAGRLIPVTLELGGKDPLYVMDDVPDVAQAAANAVEGAFYNAGQSCCAVERIYVHAAIHDAFLEAFVAETKKLKMGDPLDASTTLGPVTRAAHLPVLEAQVNDAVALGASLLTGGKPSGCGNFFEPTVLAGVDHRMSVMKEETFGPVIGIQKVRDDAEALALMKDTEYGLTAAVFSKSEERARAVLDALEVGTGYWNCCDRVSPCLPWSGRKHSGLGETLSFLGILAFAKPKAYHLKKI